MRLFNDNELSGGAPAGADTINDGGNTAPPLDNTNGGDTQKAENANDNNGGDINGSDINGSENASGNEEGAEEAEA